MHCECDAMIPAVFEALLTLQEKPFWKRFNLLKSQNAAAPADLTYTSSTGQETTKTGESYFSEALYKPASVPLAAQTQTDGGLMAVTGTSRTALS